MNIHPLDLIKITIDEHIASHKKSMLSISEILRNNTYKLSSSNIEEVLSGDEICDNILLIDRIKNIDLYKIAYNTGFNHGRNLGRVISKNLISEMHSQNNISFRLIDGNKEDKEVKI